MKKSLFLLLPLCLLVSCADKKPIDLFLHDQKWDYYHFIRTNDSIHGYKFSAYFREKDSIVGVFRNDSLFFTRIDLSNKVASGDYLGIKKGNGFFVASDSINLQPIPEKDFNRIVDSTMNPKLSHLNKRLKKGDFIFEIDVQNWNPHERKGLTTVKVFDKKGNYLQQFQSDQFEFPNEKKLDFEYADYNFDNQNDLAFFLGNIGNRNAVISEFYLFDKRNGKFIHSETLSGIASGMGTTWDEKRKRIISESSGGGEYDYKIHSSKDTNFVLLKKLRVNFGFRGDSVLVTRTTLKNGKYDTIKRTIREKNFDYRAAVKKFLNE
ncbi:hypothetical protein [Flavobacterium sp.]|uniref:XAC2610-related protein n=1 Tax=Flavobacterium sp. TaxID=239 RepID=UPI00122039B8|nr:hypothetical protein [Flavobacterium sp.]RZJ71899.1 MAG: hypothetical protein EOO49_07675 [Flavobacterium sp.]